ncbi:hypothetical protein [Desertivirga arenae]|uniref:hypothetical protein n=1 Tax=Desertivirga arenae TaxID=2810309 RepID=UPI001A96D01C|nr:hypothetical protein [Pedobacter sp. SYSU D00823]
MKNLITTFLFSILFSTVFSQALFPKLTKNVSDSGFCMDCGDIKATADSAQFSGLLKFISTHNYINKTKGIVKFQLLIDSIGQGRVLSHTDTNNTILVQNIAHQLNNFKGWKPASTNSVPERLASIIVTMVISNDKITGGIERIDSTDTEFYAGEAGTFYNTGKPALTKPKSYISRKTYLGMKTYRTKSLLNSVIYGLGFSPRDNSEQWGRFNPISGLIYDPFNYNKTLSPITIQQFKVNQFWLTPLYITGN